MKAQRKKRSIGQFGYGTDICRTPHAPRTNRRPTERLSDMSPVPFYSALAPKQRSEIIDAYARVLERCSSSFELESALPFQKSLIRQAIYEELLENPESDLRSRLEVAFAQLESFLPAEEYKLLRNFKIVGSLAEEIASSGNPVDILESAQILKRVEGDSAVEIQEKISEKMRKRLKQIQSIGTLSLSAGSCPWACASQS